MVGGGVVVRVVGVPGVWYGGGNGVMGNGYQIDHNRAIIGP